jgi:hypothetical protein
VGVLSIEEPALGLLGELAPLYPIIDLGLSGVLIGVIIWFVRRRETLVSSGEWVSKRELDYNLQVFNARLADKDHQIEVLWATNETSERARELLSHQNRDLIDAVRAYERFFDVFGDVIKRAQREDDAGEPRT